MSTGTPLARYLGALWHVRSTGEALEETSYYPALAELLGTIGGSLKPKVFPVVNLKNRGAGIPDCGLFTPDQLMRTTTGHALLAQLPARGAVEAKGPRVRLPDLAKSPQVKRYAHKYRQVLITNLREFALVAADGSQPKVLETFSLAATEEDFWKLAKSHNQLDVVISADFEAYLGRVLTRPAPIVEPEALAAGLAEYAKAAKEELSAARLAQLGSMRSALEDALGLKFVGQHGEEFFRSSLVQTVFYGHSCSFRGSYRAAWE